jgi:hypothetical protein
MWLPKNPKKKRIFFINSIFLQKKLKNWKIYIYIYILIISVQTNDIQKKYRKCSLEVPKNWTHSSHRNTWWTFLKLWDQAKTALHHSLCLLAGRANKQVFVRIVRKVWAKESPNFSKAKTWCKIEIPRHSPCTYYYLLWPYLRYDWFDGEIVGKLMLTNHYS